MKNATEKRLTRDIRVDAEEQISVELVRMWLTDHHAPEDAAYLLSFLNGDCEHPYPVFAPDARNVTTRVCDLCGIEQPS